MGTITTLILLLGLGAVMFCGYIYYQVKINGSPKENTEETSDELKLIEKSKELKLIQTTKQVQTLAEKNSLFRRTFHNVYGEEESKKLEPELSSVESIEPGQQKDQNDMAENAHNQASISAKTLDDDHIFDNAESGEPVLSEKEEEEFRSSFETIADLNDFEVDTIHKEISKPALEDKYTEEDLFHLTQLYNTVKASYSK